MKDVGFTIMSSLESDPNYGAFKIKNAPKPGTDSGFDGTGTWLRVGCHSQLDDMLFVNVIRWNFCITCWQ